MLGLNPLYLTDADAVGASVYYAVALGKLLTKKVLQYRRVHDSLPSVV